MRQCEIESKRDKTPVAKNRRIEVCKINQSADRGREKITGVQMKILALSARLKGKDKKREKNNNLGRQRNRLLLAF